MMKVVRRGKACVSRSPTASPCRMDGDQLGAKEGGRGTYDDSSAYHEVVYR